jgi:hypothetical protein
MCLTWTTTRIDKIKNTIIKNEAVKIEGRK